MQNRSHTEAPVGLTAAHPARKKPGWKSQFSHPTGRMGRFVGHVMALKNHKMNTFAVEILDVQSTDSVLEIGFGHGRTVKLIALKGVGGFVGGVDPSTVMIEQATRRNRRAVREGRVELREGLASKIPFADGRFDKVLAVNTFYHWEDPQADLEEICRVLKPGGCLVLGLRMNAAPGKIQFAPGCTDAQIEDVKATLRRSGFRHISETRRNLDREIVCLSAAR